jgi:DNA-binding MarR family transcriptional regulator
VGAATQAFQRSTDAFDDAVAGRLGLNRTDLRCLDWLSDGPLSAGRLATATGLSSAATTTLLDRLERRGLVRRVRDPSDRRKVLIVMTDLGRRQTGALYGPLAREGARLLERFSDEQLAAMRDQLLAATELIDRHRVRLRGEPSGAPDRPPGDRLPRPLPRAAAGGPARSGRGRRAP